MKYFALSEFTCKCGCGYNVIKPDFIEKLITAREISGVAYVINSGCRCKTHNQAIGSSSENHVEGRAVDIKATDSRTRMKVLEGLIKAGFNRIGINFEHGFIHADNMDKIGAPADVCWKY